MACIADSYGIKKERLIVKQLRDFIDYEQEYNIAVLTGIRRVGKNIALKQLNQHYPDSTYIDFSRKDEQEAYPKLWGHMEDGSMDEGLLLIDDISYHPEYLLIAPEIADMARKHKIKVIMAGSSITHMLSLSAGALDGQSQLFRLPVMSFIEYLYFSDKIGSYEDQAYTPSPEDWYA